jgi:plastocyanin
MPRAPLLFSLLPALLLACGGDGGSDITQPGPRPVNSVSIVSGAETKGTAAYSPNPVTVPVNAVVRWYNDDTGVSGGPYGGSSGTVHTVVADDNTSFVSPNIEPGRTFEHTFATAGTFNYHCNIHPTMKGTVTVTP